MPGTMKDREIQSGDKTESLVPFKFNLVGEAKVSWKIKYE